MMIGVQNITCNEQTKPTIERLQNLKFHLGGTSYKKTSNWNKSKQNDLSLLLLPYRLLMFIGNCQKKCCRITV